MTARALPSVLLVATAACLGLSILAAEQPTASAVFTGDQAAAGRAAYQTSCASCHLPTLVGRDEASPLAGPNFMNVWRTRTSRELFENISQTMPPGGATLGAETYLAITAFLLESNGASPGSQALTATTAAAIGTIASGQRPAGNTSEATPQTVQKNPQAPLRWDSVGLAPLRGADISLATENLLQVSRGWP